MSDNDVILEFYARGKAVRVTAIDPHTLVEVSVITPVSLSRPQMIQLAIRKLNYMLKKKSLPTVKPFKPGEDTIA